MRTLIAAAVAALGLAGLAGPLASSAQAEPICVVVLGNEDTRVCYVTHNVPEVRPGSDGLVNVPPTCIDTFCVGGPIGRNVLLNTDDILILYYDGHCYALDNTHVRKWAVSDPADCELGSPPGS